MLRWTRRTLETMGLDPVRGLRALARFPGFVRQHRRFRQMHAASGEPLAWAASWPCLLDARDPGGSASGHYFHQDLLVARRIFLAAPSRHIDVGSRVDGFVAHVASFRQIEVLDIREIRSTAGNIVFRRADLTQPLPPDLAGGTPSLSCLHALEHFGMGRYGDGLDPSGHRRGLTQLATLLRSGGTLYLSVPMGPSRIEYNAQRVFSLPLLLELLAERFAMRRFSYVDDAGDLHDDQPWTGPEAEACYGCRYGCAIVEAIRC